MTWIIHYEGYASMPEEYFHYQGSGGGHDHHGEG